MTTMKASHVLLWFTPFAFFLIGILFTWFITSERKERKEQQPAPLSG